MQEIEIVKKAVKEAGEAVMKFYNNPKIEYKKDKSPLTEADLASEKILMKFLKTTGYPILSEETEDDFKRLKSKKVWIIDPLDGTADFIQKNGEFSIMVGLVENGRPILGAVYQPADKKLFYAEKGKGAFLETDDNKIEKLEVGQIADPKESRMVVSRNHLKPEDEKVSKDLGVSELKKSGSNGVKIGKIANNKADFFINSWTGMGEWDFCAPEIILTEAGGKITDINGEELFYNKKNSKMTGGLVASNGEFHGEIIEAVKQSRITTNLQISYKSTNLESDTDLQI